MIDELKSIYWVHGDEPYLVQEATQKILLLAKKNGFEKHSFNTQISFDWSSILGYQNSRDLFQPNIVLHIDWPNPQSTKALEDIFQEYTQHLNPETCLIINTPKLSAGMQKSAIYQLVHKVGVILPLWPINAKQFPGWLKKETHARKLSFSPEAFQILCEQHEGNLLSAIQALDRFSLCAPHSTLQPKDVLEDATQGARFNPFEMIDTLLNKEAKALFMARTLKIQGQELLPLLGAFLKTLETLLAIQQDITLGKTIDQALSAQKVWASRFPLYQKAVRTFTASALQSFQSAGVEVDRLIKTYQMELAWQHFEQLLGRMVS